jgi:hypothetical protein
MLERYADGCLSDAGWRGRDYAAEVRGAENAVDCGWAEELGVVEGVEEFKTELHAYGFVDWYGFGQSHVEVFLAGTVEVAPLDVAGVPSGWKSKAAGLKKTLLLFCG